MQIYGLPALETNYFWLLQPDSSQPDAYIFDPGDAQPVRRALKQHRLSLKGIVLTHHHWDHTDGIDALLEHSQVPVYGPRSDRIPQVTHPLADGDEVQLGETRWQVLATPGHTLDHVVYYRADAEPHGVLIAGDTLFAGGCGRMFEGTPDVFINSLTALARLPAQTTVYCSHEYTLANLNFALAVEPDNQALIERIATERTKREQQLPTIPSNMALELSTNPFLRCSEPQVISSAAAYSGRSLSSAEDVFAVLRQWKNDFPSN
ncbi:hydroxyacylglutathione hydrolase [Gilvimarinus agarilyticus]|uniref:hydroxyacylglutathione hydrolase n=1 Tax=Gilvimarinus agarilyticus TaxID=679259 RepID=UPI0005A26FF3|nr:hydroxyacylglutathione hydrolase [Gilvimarinus agarilyticus]